MAIAADAALSGVAAPPANAAALTDETLTGTVAFDSTQCALSYGNSASSTYTFTASGTATGPYNGPFTETGSATATSEELLIGSLVTSVTITDPVNGVVIGTMMFSAPSPNRDGGICSSNIPTDAYINAPVDGVSQTGVTYTAQTPDCTDHGMSTVQAFADDGRGSSSFVETLDSTGCTPNGPTMATPTITKQASAPVAQVTLPFGGLRSPTGVAADEYRRSDAAGRAGAWLADQNKSVARRSGGDVPSPWGAS